MGDNQANIEMGFKKNIPKIKRFLHKLAYICEIYAWSWGQGKVFMGLNRNKLKTVCWLFRMWITKMVWDSFCYV